MKLLGQRNISALCALLLAGTVLTSVTAESPKVITEPAETLEFEEDLSYMDDVQEYVDDYLESLMDVEEDDANVIKIYDENGELVLEEDLSMNELSEDATRLLRQSEFLTEYDDTTYYRLNS